MEKTTHQIEREEMARREVGRTAISRAAALFLVVSFLAAIYAVPILQETHGISLARALRPPSARPAVANLVSFNRWLLAYIHQIENAIDDNSIIGRWARPPVQLFFAKWLGVGNEKAYCGRATWLFYRPDVDSLTGPGFLDPRQLARRRAGGQEWTARVQPDPVRAILHFNEQLAARGIVLIVMPAPGKAAIHPDKLSGAFSATADAVANSSHAQLIAGVERHGIRVFDPSGLFIGRKRVSGRQQYLAADTHWTPAAMEYAAMELAAIIQKETNLPRREPVGYRAKTIEIENLGDTAVMLNLPADQTHYPPERVHVRQVLQPDGDLWRPTESADVLVLGDSFCNIYSLAAMGWGEAAGLIEHLSYELQRPMDSIVRNDNGAYATRELLARELARGRDRLAGKRVVVYQFAARELAFGDWKLIDLTLGAPAPARFVVPPAGREWIARGTVRANSPVPRPGTVPYKDHIFALHLVDVETDDGAIQNAEALVYMASMKDNVWTDAARYRPGDEVRVRLRPWSDVAAQYGGINRSELDDDALLMETPCWGEALMQ